MRLYEQAAAVAYERRGVFSEGYAGRQEGPASSNGG